MTRITFNTVVSMIVLLSASVCHAGDPSTWISMGEAVDIARQQVNGSTPIKAELYKEGLLHYEIKTFKGNTLYEIKINPDTGNVFLVDGSNGGGAQDKIAEAQTLIATSAFTLKQAMTHLEGLYPNSYFREIEMRIRDGVPVFDADLIRGPYRIDLHMRASDGEIVKQQTKIYSSNSVYYNMYVPGPGVNWNTGNLRGCKSMINAAQDRFGGKVFDIELDKMNSTFYRYEVRILKNNKVIKAKYNARTGVLLSTKINSDAQYVSRVKSSMNTAELSLKQAINKARSVVPHGPVTKAQLQIGDNKRRYEIEFLTPSGFVEVKVNSVTGAITSISFTN